MDIAGNTEASFTEIEYPFLKGSVDVEQGRSVEVGPEAAIPRQNPNACVAHVLGITRALYEPEFVWDDAALEAEVGLEEDGAYNTDYFRILLQSGKYNVTNYSRVLDADYLDMSPDVFSELLGRGFSDEEKALSDSACRELLGLGMQEERRQPDFELVYEQLCLGRLVVASVHREHFAAINGIEMDDDGEVWLSELDSSSSSVRLEFSDINDGNPLTRSVAIIQPVA